jgi:homoserine trans-succinylase
MKVNVHSELEYAKDILNNGFTGRYNIYELKILVKYWKHLGHKPKERKGLLYEFCEKHIQDFSEVGYFKSLNKVLNFASKKVNKLIVVDYMRVSNNELEYIDALDIEHEEKKFLFCMYMQHKLNRKKFFISHDEELESKNFGGTSKRYKNIFEMSKLPSNKWSYKKIISELKEKGIVEVKNNSRVELVFIDEIDTDNEICQIIIPTFDWHNLGYYYDRFYKDGIKECSLCRSLIRVVKPLHTYCRDCAKEMHRIRDKKGKEKARNKGLSTG